MPDIPVGAVSDALESSGLADIASDLIQKLEIHQGEPATAEQSATIKSLVQQSPDAATAYQKVQQHFGLPDHGDAAAAGQLNDEPGAGGSWDQQPPVGMHPDTDLSGTGYHDPDYQPPPLDVDKQGASYAPNVKPGGFGPGGAPESNPATADEWQDYKHSGEPPAGLDWSQTGYHDPEYGTGAPDPGDSTYGASGPDVTPGGSGFGEGGAPPASFSQPPPSDAVGGGPKKSVRAALAAAGAAGGTAGALQAAANASNPETPPGTSASRMSSPVGASGKPATGGAAPADPVLVSGAQGARTIQEKMASEGLQPTASVEVQTIPEDIAKYGSSPKIATPAAFQKEVDDLSAEGKQYHDTTQLAGDQQKVLDDWAAKKQQLADVYADAKQRVGWAEAASLLGQGLARLGAGLYGMRTGVDTSGIKFDYYDWSKQYSRALDEYRLGLDQTEKEMQPRLQAIQEQRRDYENWRLRMEQARGNLGNAQLHTAEANANNANAARQRLIDVLKFNAQQTNESRLRQRQWDIESARYGNTVLDTKYHVGEAMWAKDSTDYNQVLKDNADGLAALADAANTANPKEREAKVKAAMPKIGAAYQDPTAAARIISESGGTGGFAGFGTHTDYQKVIQELNRLPKRAAPRPLDYMPGGRMWDDVRNVSGAADSAGGAGGTGNGGVGGGQSPQATQRLPIGTRAKTHEGRPMIMTANGWAPDTTAAGK